MTPRILIPLSWMLLSVVAVPAAAQGSPDWGQVTEETLGHLRALIRLDTTNPPGNEEAAARYLKQVLDQEGIQNELIEMAAGRAALVARLPASVPQPEDPLLLVGHLDVVGVEREKWAVDPFAAVVKDGAVWGRGALDDKAMVAAELTALVLLKRRQVPLRRPVVLLAETDEEGGGGYGMDSLVDRHFSRFHARYALNEGGRILEENGRVAFVGIQVNEKSSHNVTLVAKGPSGHASLPHGENPIVRLSVALAKLAAYRAPAKLNPATARFFQNLARTREPETAAWMERLGNPSQLQQAADELSRRSLHWNALLRNTLSPTLLEGGIRTNVIPGEARANLNVRLLPGESLADFVKTLKQVVDDPHIEFVYPSNPEPEPPGSPLDGEFYQAIAEVAAEMFPQAAVTPYMHQATTSSGPLRAHGVEAYGLLVFPITQEELLLLHASDERLRLDSLRRGVEFLYRVVRDFAGAP